MEKAHVERLFRARFAHFLFLFACKLHLPNTCGTMSIVFMHRYFDFLCSDSSSTNAPSESLLKEDRIILSAALVFLASKLSENPRKLRDVINISRWISGSVETLDLTDELYYHLKCKIIEKEHFILRALGFILHVDLPHASLLEFAK